MSELLRLARWLYKVQAVLPVAEAQLMWHQLVGQARAHGLLYELHAALSEANMCVAAVEELFPQCTAPPVASTPAHKWRSDSSLAQWDIAAAGFVWKWAADPKAVRELLQALASEASSPTPAGGGVIGVDLEWGESDECAVCQVRTLPACLRADEVALGGAGHERVVSRCDGTPAAAAAVVRRAG